MNPFSADKTRRRLFLKKHNIEYSCPTAGHYLLHNTGETKVVWYPKSNKARIDSLEEDSKTVEIGEATEENILKFFQQYLIPASQ